VYCAGAAFRVMLPEFRRQTQNPGAWGGPEDGEGGIGEITRRTGTTGNEADQSSGRTGKDQATVGRVGGSTTQSTERSQQRHQRGKLHSTLNFALLKSRRRDSAQGLSCVVGVNWLLRALLQINELIDCTFYQKLRCITVITRITLLRVTLLC